MLVHYTHEKYGGIEMEAERPKIMGWVKRCMTEPSFYDTIPNPHKLYEALVEFNSLENLNAKNGVEVDLELNIIRFELKKSTKLIQKNRGWFRLKSVRFLD